MENKQLVWVALTASAIGLISLLILSVTMEPEIVSSHPEEHVGEYVVLQGVVSHTYEKFFVVHGVEVFSVDEIERGDYVVVRGTLENTPKKYVDRGFPKYQLYPEDLEHYVRGISFFPCYVENHTVSTVNGRFQFDRSFSFTGFGGVLGELKDKNLIIRDIFPLQSAFIEGKVRKDDDQFYIGDTRLVLPENITPEFGDNLKCYGLADEEFLCLYCQNTGKSIEKISNFIPHNVYTVKGGVVSRRYYYDGHLITLEDATGKVTAFVETPVYYGYTVEVSGIYEEFRGTYMLRGEATVISNKIHRYDLAEELPQGTFWAKGTVKKVEDVRGHLYLYMEGHKISVYADTVKDLQDHGIDLFNSRGSTLTVLLEHSDDLILVDVRK